MSVLALLSRTDLELKTTLYRTAWLHALPCRGSMQTRKAGDIDVYDDEQMDVLEQKTAKEFDGSVEDVRT